LLEVAFGRHEAATWVDRLIERAVPAALIKTVPEALDDARLAGRGMIVPLTEPGGGVIETVATPIRYADADPAEHAFPPRLGADTDEILAGLGYTAAQVAGLRDRGVLAPAPERTGNFGR
jgi:CoA:oxalate CoA-transferase